MNNKLRCDIITACNYLSSLKEICFLIGFYESSFNQHVNLNDVYKKPAQLTNREQKRSAYFTPNALE